MKRVLGTALILSTALLTLFFSTPASARRQESEKTIYFTAMKDNKPMKDLKAADVAAAEDKTKFYPASSLKLATTPISIVMLADTSAVAGGAGLDRRSTSATAAGDMMHDIKQAFQEFARYMIKANPQNELALMEFGQASIMVQDFTSKPEELEKSVTRLVSKPDADSVLLEAIMESSKELGKRKNARRAIVSINVMPDSERSREPANNIMKELAKDQAWIFSVSLQKGDSRNSTRGTVLQGFADLTGGHHDDIVGQSALVDQLKAYADILNAQYEMKYMRPAGAPPQSVQMASNPALGQIKFYSTKFPPQ